MTAGMGGIGGTTELGGLGGTPKMGGSEGPPGLRGSEGSPALGARRCRPAGGAAPAAPRPAGRGRCRAGAACSAHPSPSLPSLLPCSYLSPPFPLYFHYSYPAFVFLPFLRGCVPWLPSLPWSCTRLSLPCSPSCPAPCVSSVYPGVFLCSSPRHSALPLCSSLHEMELNNCTGADFSVPAICPCVEAPLLLWYFGCIRAANTRTITKLWISACAFLDHNEI